MPYGRAEAFSVSINAKVFCMRGFKFIDGSQIMMILTQAKLALIKT